MNILENIMKMACEGNWGGGGETFSRKFPLPLPNAFILSKTRLY